LEIRYVCGLAIDIWLPSRTFDQPGSGKAIEKLSSHRCSVWQAFGIDHGNPPASSDRPYQIGEAGAWR